MDYATRSLQQHCQYLQMAFEKLTPETAMGDLNCFADLKAEASRILGLCLTAVQRILDIEEPVD